MPFNVAQSGKPAGISIDVVNEMAKRAGIAARFEILPWDTAYRRAQAEKNTCLYSTARIEVRERLFRWIGPIATNKYVLVAKNDFPANVKTEADARKYKIGAVKTDVKAELLRQRAITNIVEFDTEAQIPPKLFLKKGDPARIDMWVSGLYTYNSVAEKAKVAGVKTVFVAGEQPAFLACRRLRLKHSFTRAYRPQTNGKVARFIQSALREWAYGIAYNQSSERAQMPDRWIHHCNWHRPRQRIGGLAPNSRLA